MPRQKPPRERAARALCKRDGVPEDTKFEGRAMLESYLDEVDTVLKAAPTPKEFEKLKAE